MPDSPHCPTCGAALQPGQAECPNCGATIESHPVKPPVHSPEQPGQFEQAAGGNKTGRTVKTKKVPQAVQATQPALRKIEAQVETANQMEALGDHGLALTIYKKALAQALQEVEGDPSLRPTVQMLGLLIQRLETGLQPPAPDKSAEPPAPVTPPALPVSHPEVPSPSAAPLDRENSVEGKKAAVPPATVKAPRRKSALRQILSFLLGLVVIGGLAYLVIGFNSDSPQFADLGFLSTKTSTPTVSPTSPPVWDVSLYDTFNSNDYGWPEKKQSQETCGTESLVILNRALTWQLSGSNQCFWAEIPAGIPSLSDFSASVNVQRLSGSSASDFGIIFRANGTGDNPEYFYFAINDQAQTFGLFARTNAHGWINLINWSGTASVKPGQPNQMGVRMTGTNMLLSINDTEVATMQNVYLPEQGTLGIGANLNGSSTPLKLIYDDLELRGASVH